MEESALQQAREQYQPTISPQLKQLLNMKLIKKGKSSSPLTSSFPKTAEQELVQFQEGALQQYSPLTIGVVFSGGQAPGGHNVITGLYDALQTMGSGNRLIGFCGGPSGIIENRTIPLDDTAIAPYRNQGGFDLIGSGRTKIETPEQFRAVQQTIEKLKLNGLVVIGGDDSNTNAALLAEYFEANQVKCCVAGVPKTIDGDLKNDFIEISFGFDTATKIYSEIIGNIMRDTLSAKKSYYFMKLMGRSASHITLECALQTHPNFVLIAEEIQQEHKTLNDVVADIADMVCVRAEQDKHYGVVLIPEGVLEFIPECKQLISELNVLMAADKPHAAALDKVSTPQEKWAYVERLLSEESKTCFRTFPIEIRTQLLLDRDPHGNVQVSKIETERLLIELVNEELKQRKKKAIYHGKFSAQPYFCGYEGRAGFPSNFDCQYCYSLGYVAALLLGNRCTGYICCIKGLLESPENWEFWGIPIISMMTIELRHGKAKPVVKKALVDLEDRPFRSLMQQREGWVREDLYRYPGPLQFFGPSTITETRALTLFLEKSKSRETISSNR